MTNHSISDTGFWTSYEDWQHSFVEELSVEINKYIEKNNIKSVYDFGCGTGEYLLKLSEFDKSIFATGFEGHTIDGVFNNIVKRDLSQPFKIEPVDLVLSIEVGEHIPKQYESNFFNNISTHAKSHVILSWAIEGQGGVGHINCQNNDYVIDQMLMRGWDYQEEVSMGIRKLMPDNWLKNTVMVFTKRKHIENINYHIIYINDERKWNREQIESYLNGNKHPIDSLNAKIDSNKEKFLEDNKDFKISWEGYKPGELGNFASHYLAWKYVAENNLDNLLVFEDDAKISESFIHKYRLFLENCPKDYDVFSIFVHENQFPRFNSNDIINENVSRAYQDWSTLCYIVSNSGAKKLLNYVKYTGMDYPTDWFIFRHGSKGIFNVYTFPPEKAGGVEIDNRYESQVQ